MKAHISKVPALEALLRDMQASENSPYFCSPGPEDDDAVRRFAERHCGWDGHGPFVPVTQLTGQALRDFVHISGRNVVRDLAAVEALSSKQDVVRHKNHLDSFRLELPPIPDDVGMWKALFLMLTMLIEDFMFTTVHVEFTTPSDNSTDVHMALFWEERKVTRTSASLERWDLTSFKGFL